ncbi:lipopolysaccharide-binding protein-like isoform X2 [Clavelina lepadiformis]|uniref:lipopolysaccharide-binding protein-like isoform X2 n=1 Tax=Clavelina lepadiformis TaxID=159417 RepID=UPI004040EF92
MEIEKRSLFFLCMFALVLACLCDQSGVNPGVKARVTSGGLKFLSQIALGFAEDAVEDLDLPTLSGTSPVEYKISNLKINSFSLGRIGFNTAAPNVITPVIDDGKVSASAQFEASKTIKVFGFSFPIAISGNIHASASGLDLSQQISLGMNADGKPTFSLQNCDSSIGDLDLKVSGTTLDAAFNLIIGLFKSTITDLLQKEICPAVKKALSKQGEKVTEKFKLVYPLIKQTNIDLGLVCDPEATGTEFLVSLKGKCFASSMPNIPRRYVALPMPPISATSKMACISVSPYVLNTLLYAFSELGHLGRTFDFDESHMQCVCLYSSVRWEFSQLFCPTCKLFRTSKKALHVEHTFRVQIVVSATSAPSVDFTASGIGIEGPFEVVVNAVLPDDSKQHVITIMANVDILAKARIENGNFAGNIESLDVTVTDAGGLPAELFNQLFQAFIPQAILPAINGITEAGFEIPSLFDFCFSGASIIHKKDALEVCTDFELCQD